MASTENKQLDLDDLITAADNTNSSHPVQKRTGRKATKTRKYRSGNNLKLVDLRPARSSVSPGTKAAWRRPVSTANRTKSRSPAKRPKKVKNPEETTIQQMLASHKLNSSLMERPSSVPEKKEDSVVVQTPMEKAHAHQKNKREAQWIAKAGKVLGVLAFGFAICHRATQGSSFTSENEIQEVSN